MPELDSPKVKHRPLVKFNRETLDEDSVTFYVNNKIFQGFKNVSISRNLMSLTGDFQVVILDKYSVDAEDFDILPGDRIHCHLGKEALFEGYVDTFKVALAPGSRNITVSGRDRTADLIDCSHEGASEFNKLKLETIAAEMLKPFGLKVILADSVDTGKEFEKFTVRQGETVFEALSRAAKERDVLLLSTTHGNLLIEKRGISRASSELTEGVNILSISSEFNNTERFSTYKVKGQQPGIIGEPEDTNASLGEATDSGITRYRPNIIISESSVDNEAAQKRANFELSLNIAKSVQVSCKVKGWRQKDGSLWRVNQLVRVSSRSVGIKDQMLVSSVKFNKGSGGRMTDITLVRKDSFNFIKKAEKADDPLAEFK